MSCLPQRLKLSLLALLGAFWLWSCDSSSPQAVAVVDVPGSTLYLSIPDSSCLPDSIAWSHDKEHGTASFGGTPSTFWLNLRTTSFLNRDTVRLELWTLGLRTRRLLTLSTTDGRELTAIEPAQVDTFAQRILADFRTWFRAYPDSLTLPGRAQKTDLVKFCARRALAGAAGYRSLPQVAPTGLDLDSLRYAALATVLQKRLPLYALAPCFVSSIEQSAWIDALLRQGRLQTSDTAGLNALPLRIAVPVKLVDSLQVDGSAIGVVGSFAWPSGLRYLPQVVVRSSRGLDTCVQPAILKPPLASDTAWDLSGNLRLQALSCAEPGADTLLIALRDSLGHGLVARIPFGVRPKAQPPRIVRLSPTKQTGNVLPYEHDTLVVSWRIANWREVDVASVKIQDMTGFRQDDSTWTAWVKLDAVAQTQAFTFRAKSKSGLDASDFIEATRAPDTAGPSISWRAPLGKLTLAYENLSYRVQVDVQDFSGVDSVRIGGWKAQKDDAGTWSREVALAANGRDTSILVEAWDAWGNRRTDSCTLRRQTATADILPVLEMISPRGVSQFVPLDTDSVTVVWKVWSPYGIDTASVRCNGLRGHFETRDSSWTVRLAVPPTGQVYPLTAKVYDLRGKSQSGQALLVRARDTVPPVIANATGADPFPYESATASLAIRATDNHKVAGVVLNAEILSPDASGIFRKTVSLKVGKNAFPVVATDSMGNVKRDTLYLVRNAAAPQHVLSNAHVYRPLFDSLKFSGDDGDSLAYSLDGVNWTRYRSPIPVDEPTTIYAKAYPGGAIKALTIGTVRNPFTSGAVSIASSFFLKGDSLWAMGSNNYGQLGISGTVSYSVPTFVMDGVAKVSSYNSSTLILMKNGYVYAAGYNSQGCLGTGSTTTVTTLRWVAAGIQDVVVGSGFSLLLTQSGSVYAAGNNAHGQLGLGANASRSAISSFTLCPGLSKIKIAGISVSESSSFAWTAAGQSYACGSNIYGLLGTGDTGFADTSAWLPSMSNVQDIRSSNSSAEFLLKDGSVYGVGLNLGGNMGSLPAISPVPTLVQTGVSRIFTSYLNYYHLKGSTLWGSGTNSNGLLGQPNGYVATGAVVVSESVKEVFTGYLELMLIRNDGSIWVLGYNAASQYGSDNPTYLYAPTLIDF